MSQSVRRYLRYLAGEIPDEDLVAGGRAAVIQRRREAEAKRYGRTA